MNARIHDSKSLFAHQYRKIAIEIYTCVLIFEVLKEVQREDEGKNAILCMKFANTNANDFEYKSRFNEPMWKYTKIELIEWESANVEYTTEVCRNQRSNSMLFHK